MKRSLWLAALSLCAACGGDDTGDFDLAGADLGPPAPVGSGIFPADNEWNRDISGDPVAAGSDAYIATIGAGTSLKADWSSVAGGNYGIPYVVVPAEQPLVPINFTGYPEESDPGPYPIPLDAPIEGGGDGHVIAVDPAHRMLYELFIANRVTGGFEASAGAKFDLSSNALRPAGWTSADAAGLPIFPGLARADEVIDKGEIKHALRFTVVQSQKGYVFPARHFASSSTDPARPPMGLRVRLKASVDISKAGPQARVVLTALKKYGMFVADNGSNWFITGAPDPRWDDDDLRTMAQFHGSDFEAVAHGPITDHY
jgi:hypothetical protein